MDQELLKLLNPGRRVEIKLPADKAMAVVVYQFGLGQMKKYADVIGKAVETLLTMQIDMGSGSGAPAVQYAARMIPYVVCTMMPLVEECCRVEPKGLCTVSELPHQYLPAIVEAWIHENFDDPTKWLPWMAVAEKVVNGLSEQKISISETVSKILSLQATGSKTSSTAQQEAPPATPIPAGASGN